MQYSTSVQDVHKNGGKRKFVSPGCLAHIYVDTCQSLPPFRIINKTFCILDVRHIVAAKNVLRYLLFKGNKEDKYHFILKKWFDYLKILQLSSRSRQL